MDCYAAGLEGCADFFEFELSVAGGVDSVEEATEFAFRRDDELFEFGELRGTASNQNPTKSVGWSGEEEVYLY